MVAATNTLVERLRALEGFIPDPSGDRLLEFSKEVPKDEAIVEIGSFKGKSACFFGVGARSGKGAHVYSIDPWDLPGNVYGKHGFTDPEVMKTWARQIGSFNLANQVTAIREFSYNAAKTWDKPVGLLFIDGDHQYHNVKRDWEVFSPFLTLGATVIFDDYGGPNRGVTKFVEELRRQNLLMDWDFDTPPLAIAHVRKPATNLSLSVSIMAHPARERFIPYLKEKLGDVQVVWDEKNDRWDTGRRSMLAFDPNATHHIVVQDDALVSQNFIPAVKKAITCWPENPTSYYIGMVRPSRDVVNALVRRAVNAKQTWVGMEGPWWGVAVCVPTKLIPEMIAWCDQRTDVPNYDMRMSRFFGQKKLLCYYSIPSLVSHRTGEDNPSLVPGRLNSDSRVAHMFIGENADASAINWSPMATYR